ncbi:MAG: hypothetical protein COB71_03420 [Thiotrichales bacterium]|nr:MAG: hypothetical protein COB71_03420 [Thiotrichales bacterium]
MKTEKDHCPLCGGQNRCQSEMAQACQDGPCWCRAETFPAVLLARLAEKERDVRCLCLSCLRAFEAEQVKS